MSRIRGRKRSAKPRHPGGQVKREKVGPTPQQEARRAYLAGADKGGKPRDAAKTGYPLGILLVNEAISEHQHRAGCRYAWLYETVYGRVSIAAANYDFAPRAGKGWAGGGPERSRDLPDAEFARREREVRHAIAQLSRLGVREATDGVCLLGRVPRWMRPIPPTDVDVADADRLLLGLSELTLVLNDVG